MRNFDVRQKKTKQQFVQPTQIVWKLLNASAVVLGIDDTWNTSQNLQKEHFNQWLIPKEL